MSKSLFCFGYGYTCDYLGHELMASGNWSVFGTTRDSQKQDMLKRRGITSYIFDYQTPLQAPSRILQDITHILISTPPDDRGDPTYLMHEDDICHLPNLEWIGYLSATSIYGDRDGKWVDETAFPEPTSKRGSRRLRAEKQWQAVAERCNLPLHIFRLSGIYGPGRSALDSVRAGIARRIEKEGHAFNRIHVEDIVQTLIASMNNPQPNSIYNLADNEAAPSHEIISYACKLLNIQPPPLIPYEEADLAPIARSFYKDNKRIKNNKIKEDLGIQLKYPNHRLGLQACLDAEEYNQIQVNGH